MDEERRDPSAEGLPEEVLFRRPNGHGKVKGDKRTAYILKREMKPRHKFIAGLAGAGLTASQIGRLVKRDQTKPETGYHSLLLRDPRMRKEIDKNREAILSEAKEILTSSIVSAAQNFHDAVVHDKDMNASSKVLQFAGVFTNGAAQPAGTTNVNISFGKWLSDAQPDNALLINEDGKTSLPDKQLIARHVDEIPEAEAPIQGMRLVDNHEEEV